MSRVERIGRATLHLGDCRDVLRDLPDASVDSVVCDPPYELGFMGKAWDASGIANDQAMWAEVLRVLKPGGHSLAFSGSRTYHRMTCAIEDAGFEIRDQLQWIYGSGFPKSHNQPGGWGTALKPAHEPICLARKPLSERTVAANVLAHGTGAINIDACRVETADQWNASTRGPSDSIGTFKTGARTTQQHAQGRWPANIIHDGSDEVLAGFPQSNARDGATKGSGIGFHEKGTAVDRVPAASRSDAGSAARFFYCAKTSKGERGEGNGHPTVKPIALMRWLVRMVTPPGGTVLDPFAGSGSTLIAAAQEGFHAIGCEMSPEYLDIACRRLRPDAGPLFGAAA